MNISINRWIVGVIGLFGVLPSLFAINAQVYVVDTILGRRGEAMYANYNNAPHQDPIDNQYGWIKENADLNRLFFTSTEDSLNTPLFSRSDLKSYAVFSGKNGNATKAIFEYTPTSDYPLLYIYWSGEIEYGVGEHTPLYQAFRVKKGGTQIGCEYYKSYNLSLAEQDSTFHYLHGMSHISGGYAGYEDWQVRAYDLSEYIDGTVTIEVEATCCSNVKCMSSLRVAFEKDTKVRGECDINFLAPSFSNPVWHDGDETGPIISTAPTLPVHGINHNYTCVIDSCSDPLYFTAVNGCPCRDPEYATADTIVEVEKLPFTWHNHTFTGADSCIDTLRNIGDCDSIIYSCSLQVSYSLIIYADGCAEPNVWYNLLPGTTIEVQVDSLNEDYHFSHWDDGDTTNPRIFTITDSNIVDTAYFIKDSTYSITIYSDSCSEPNVFDGLKTGDTIMIEALPKDTQSVFVCWADSSTTNPRIYVVGQEDIVDTAHFYTEPFVSITVYSDGCSEPNIFKDIPIGTIIIVTPIPTEDGEFDHWSDNNTDNPRTFVVTTDSIITAIWAKDCPIADTIRKDTAICKGSTLEWHEQTISEAGIYYDTARSVSPKGAMCDSVLFELKVTVNQLGTSEQSKTICDKQLPYTWKDQVCTAAGDYTFDTLTIHGCDSVITLHLKVKAQAETDTVAYICREQLPFIWHGKSAVDGDTIHLINSVGCDSIVTLRLTISALMQTIPVDTTICDTLLPYIWRGRVYTDQGVYRDTISSLQYGCDSVEYIYSLFTQECKKEPTCVDSLVYRKWDDVLFCDNGKAEFVAYQWYQNLEKMEGETKQYLYKPETMGTAAYHVVATRADGTKLESCPKTFYDRPASATTYGTVSKVPNRQGVIKVTVPDCKATLIVFDVVGRLFYNETIASEVEKELPITGTYIILLKGESGESIRKIIN